MPKCDNTQCGYRFEEGDSVLQRVGACDVPMFFCGEGCQEQWKEDREKEISKPVNGTKLKEGAIL